MIDRSARALDWDVVCDALALCARTRRGAAAAAHAPLWPSSDQVRERYAEVTEVDAAAHAGDEPPVGGVLDIDDAVDRASRGGVLEVVDLREVDTCARALDAVRRWADARDARLPRLAALCVPIQVDPELLEVLRYAFDAAGQLDEGTWPELGVLRRRVEQLRDRIRSALEEIVRGDEWREVLQDRFISEREGRFVVPVKMAARKGLGIVHGTSGSGETAFVEPAAVVEMHNELKETESELHRVERRILTELSREVGRRHGPLRAALEAAVELDLAVARAALGRKMAGIVPIVGNDGVIAIRDARHPVLALRHAEGGPAVVGNDLQLTPSRPGLVLTGPNAGGKTVALKTLGLAALLARAAIPVPAADGSRVDVFSNLVADVGDQQSVAEGLSTFSAHVGVLRAAVEAAAPGVLVLLDEVAVGTDPSQGAALARAVLERIVDQGARVVATTHYPELKALGAADGRFSVGAAQYVDGRPTYRIELGAPGASYALAMARRFGLDEDLIVRARALLEENHRALADQLEQLAVERQAVAARARALEDLEREARRRVAQVEDRERRAEKQLRDEMERQLEKHKEKLKKSEETVRAVVASLQAGTDLRGAGKALETIKATRAALAPPEAPARPPPEIALGVRLRVRSLNQVGVVTALGDSIEVDLGRIRTRVPREGLETLDGTALAAPPAPPAPPPAPPAPPEPERRARPNDDRAVAHIRTSANTVDLRGMRADEATEVAERFLDGAAHGPDGVTFVLHGHGTGALKRAVRAWLPTCRYVRAWRPADADEGGDAYTVVLLK